MTNKKFDIGYKEIWSLSHLSKSRTSDLIREAIRENKISSETRKNKKFFNKEEVLKLLNSKSIKKGGIDYKIEKEKASSEREKLKLKKEKLEFKVLEKKYIDVKIVNEVLLNLAQLTREYFENNSTRVASKITEKLQLNNEQLQQINIIIENEFENFINEYAFFIEDKGK